MAFQREEILALMSLPLVFPLFHKLRNNKALHVGRPAYIGVSQ